MRARIIALLLSVVAAGVAFAQSKELGPVKGDAKMGTTAAGGSAVKEFDPGKESALGDLVFRAPLTPGGTDALPLAVNINGQSLTPLCAYRAKDATDASWPAWGGYGETLTKVEAGANTTDQATPHLGPNEKARQFAAGDSYASASNDACGVSTEDFVLELVLRRTFATNEVDTTTRTGAAATGWSAITSGVGVNSVQLCHGATCAGAGATPGVGNLMHLVCGVDRSYASAVYGMRCYINGVNSGNADVSARAASLLSGDNFAIGDYAGSGAPSSSAIQSIILWKATDLFPGTAANATIMDAFAADRYARFVGTREQVNGIAPTSLNTGPRCAWTGGASGKLDCYSSSWAITGADMPPGQGSLGGVALGGGLLVHAQLAMPILRSRTLNTTWTQVGTGTVATSSTTPFVDARQTYKVVDNDGAGEEYIYQDIDITALVTGGKVNLCPWAATESGSQVFTMAITEMTGGSCTTTTTNYTATATTAWALHPNTHTVLDGDCTTARIELKPYDIAGGVGATGSVAALANAYPGSANYNGCLPVFVETTTAAITPTAGPLRYATPYSAALGQRQVADAGSLIAGRRTFAQVVAFPFANVALARSANDAMSLFAQGAPGAYDGLYRQGSERKILAYDAASKWLCAESRAHTGFVPAGISIDYARDLYTTWYNGNTCQSATPASAGADAYTQSYMYVGPYPVPGSHADITGMLIRNAEVYR